MIMRRSNAPPLSFACILFIVFNVWTCSANDAAELKRFIMQRQLLQSTPAIYGGVPMKHRSLSQLNIEDVGPGMYGGVRRSLSQTAPMYGGAHRMLLASTYGDWSHRMLQAPAYGGGSHRMLLAPTYGDGSRRMLQAPAYGGGSHRTLLAPTYGDGSRRMLQAPAYGDGSHRMLLAPTYGDGSRRMLQAPAYGDGSHRMLMGPGYGGAHRHLAAGAYGSPDNRELLHRALSAVLKSGNPTYTAMSEVSAQEKTHELSQILSSQSAQPADLPSTHQQTMESFAPMQVPSAGILPAGQCYCRFDYDWSEWSLSDVACRTSLYQRASDPRSGMARVWLDDYYSYKPAAGGVLMPPNADQISAFLYSDCTPAPPCSCTNAEMGALSEACYNEIQIYAADAARNVPELVLQEAVAERSDQTSEIHSWIQSAFPKGSCDAYQGEPYVYAPLAQPKHALLKAWDSVVSVSIASTQPVVLIQFLLASLCALAVLASMLVVKKLVLPMPRQAYVAQP